MAETDLFYPIDESAPLPAVPELDISEGAGITMVRSRWVLINFTQLAEARAGALERSVPPPTLRLNLFDDDVWPAVVERSAPTASASGYVLSGRLDGAETGTWRLLVYGAAIAGTVRTPNATYNIRTIDGVQAISEIERSTLPVQDLVLPNPDDLESSSNTESDAPANQAVRNDSEAVIDIAVVYTPAAVVGARLFYGDNGIDVLIDIMFDSANEAYEDSGVLLRTRLTGKELFRCEATSAICNSGPRLLRHLFDRGDEIRDKYGADLLSWIVDITGFAGVAYHGGSYNVVQYNQEDDHYTFAHEIGHNMHLQHDRWAVMNTTGGGTLNDPHPYSHGYVSRTCNWRTIMAYFAQCGKWVPALRRFSNPNQYIDGERMGVAGEANAVRTLNEMRWEVANRK